MADGGLGWLAGGIAGQNVGLTCVVPARPLAMFVCTPSQASPSSSSSSSVQGASPADPERVALWALVKFDLDWLAQVREEPLESR